MLPTYQNPYPKTKPNKYKIATNPAEAIKKQNEMIKIMCPKCNKHPGYIRLNDGASHECQYCKTVFHYCACSDAVKYGSPGPLMCENCHKYESSEELEKIHFKRYLFTKRLIKYD